MPTIKLYNNLDQSLIDVEIPCQFGREKGDLTFPSDDSVSTLHGEYIVENGSFFVNDLGSTNGTYLNGQKLNMNEKVLIEDDDLLEFGEQSFHLGVTDSFETNDVQERYQRKKTERLRKKLDASKAQNLRAIEDKIKTLNNKKNQIETQLNQISQKYRKGKVAERSLFDKKGIIDENIANFQQILTKKNSEFDQKKRDLFKKKTDLDDQIKLLTLSGESDGEKVKLMKEQLEEVKAKIDEVMAKKKSFPSKLNDLKKNQSIMESTIQETTLKLSKVEKIIQENKTKYQPILSKIEIQLEQLDREKERLNTGTTKIEQL